MKARYDDKRDARFIARFWSKVHTGASDECWEWQGSKVYKYGATSRGYEHLRAHRVAWELTYGNIPDGMNVLHKCDNPPCCNPAHLFLGTHQDNVADKVKKGRQAKGDNIGSRLHPECLSRGEKHYSHLHPEKLARGERVGGAKLTEEIVIEIRRIYANNGASQRELAREYGLTQANVWSIVNNHTWRHI